MDGLGLREHHRVLPAGSQLRRQPLQGAGVRAGGVPDFQFETALGVEAPGQLDFQRLAEELMAVQQAEGGGRLVVPGQADGHGQDVQVTGIEHDPALARVQVAHVQRGRAAQLAGLEVHVQVQNQVVGDVGVRVGVRMVVAGRIVCRLAITCAQQERGGRQQREQSQNRVSIGMAAYYMAGAPGAPLQ